MAQHFVQFYTRDNSLADRLFEFLEEGLSKGESCVVLATPPVRERIDAWLADHPDGERYRTLYAPLDARETLSRILVDGWPSESRFNAVVGTLIKEHMRRFDGRVRAFGEMVAVLCMAGNYAAALRLEELWNLLMEREPITLLCGYPMHLFASSDKTKEFRAVCKLHSHVDSCSKEYTPQQLPKIVAELQQQDAALRNEIDRRETIERALDLQRQELNDFLENAAEGIHRVTADGMILWANRAELQMLGYEADEYIAHNIRDFHVQPDVADRMLRLLANGETLQDFQAQLRCKDGAVKYVLINSNAFFVGGNFMYSRCFTRDVTARIELERTLSQKIDELAEADRRKDRFLAVLGHELRNPLAPIATSLEVLKLRGDDAELRDQIHATMQRQLNIAKRLIDDLLDLSKIKNNKLQITKERIGLAHVIERAIEVVAPQLERKGHELRTHISAGEFYLHGDEERLVQAIANILQNAVKYTPAGGHITIELQRNGATAELSIADDGIGISSDLQTVIFDSFVQGPTEQREGLGLGLTIAKSIIELHDGRVAVHSNGIGAGCEFLICLPCLATHQYAATEPLSFDYGDIDRRSIMVVDDNIDAATSLGQLLKLLGHDVRTCFSGGEALQTIAQFSPHVIFIDIEMPEVNGHELARLLRRRLGHDPVLIALTGYGQLHDRYSALEAGFNHHCVKPIDLPSIQALLSGEAIPA